MTLEQLVKRPDVDRIEAAEIGESAYRVAACTLPAMADDGLWYYAIRPTLAEAIADVVRQLEKR